MIANISLSRRVLICCYWFVLSSMWSHLLWHEYDLQLTKGLAFTSMGAVHKVRTQQTKLNGQLQLTVWSLLIVRRWVVCKSQFNETLLILCLWCHIEPLDVKFAVNEVPMASNYLVINQHSQSTQVLMVYLGLTKTPFPLLTWIRFHKSKARISNSLYLLLLPVEFSPFVKVHPLKTETPVKRAVSHDLEDLSSVVNSPWKAEEYPSSRPLSISSMMKLFHIKLHTNEQLLGLWAKTWGRDGNSAPTALSWRNSPRGVRYRLQSSSDEPWK